MKKNVLIGLLFSWLSAFAQKADSLFVRRKVSKTDIAVVYAHYLQDGNHSAVTGGQGTEKLRVYAPEVSLVHERDSNHTFSLQAGVDVVSSASTDKIDFVVSSASRKDSRVHAGAGYGRNIGGQGWAGAGSVAFSMESDYLSLGGALEIRRQVEARNREYGLRVEAFFDDLRWGRLNSDYKRPVRLIYPAELRDREWFDGYKRQSYNLMFHFFQVMNKRVQVGIFPGFSWQHGLLATPFHRVYFKDGATLRVENLPDNRFRLPFGIQGNVFISDRYVLRNYYRFYWDNFGIVGHTVEFEMPVKISPVFSAGPVLRGYTQTASRYFKPYGQHAPEQAYYTSDYDLSGFQSTELGAALRFAPFARLGKSLAFNSLHVRYVWYRRSDGLRAHILTLQLEATKVKKRRQ